MTTSNPCDQAEEISYPLIGVTLKVISMLYGTSFAIYDEFDLTKVMFASLIVAYGEINSRT